MARLAVRQSLEQAGGERVQDGDREQGGAKEFDQGGMHQESGREK
jgi:hypothetical protein